MNNSRVNLTCCAAHLFRQCPKATEMDTTPKIVHIKKNGISIGRDQNSVDVHLNSTYIPHVVSRVHAYISRSFGKWKIRDNQSSNGVFVNSKRIVDQVRLEDGDLLIFGSSKKYYIDRDLHHERNEYRYIFRINYSDPENRYEVDNYGPVERRTQSFSSRDSGKAVGYSRQKRSRTKLNKFSFEEEGEYTGNMLKRVIKGESDCVFSAVSKMSMAFATDPGEGGMFERFSLPYVPSLEEYIVASRLKYPDMRLRQSVPLLVQGIPYRNLFQACCLTGKSNGVFQNAPPVTADMSSVFGFNTVSLQRIDSFEPMVCSACRKAVLERVQLPCMHLLCRGCLGLSFFQTGQCSVCARHHYSSTGYVVSDDLSTGSLVFEHSLNTGDRGDAHFLPFLAPEVVDEVVIGLNIGCPWNDQDRKSFFELLKRSIREPNFDYCRKIGLTSDWVELASNADIIIACGNLNISIAEVTNELAETENVRSSAAEVIVALRAELLQIIRSSGR